MVDWPHSSWLNRIFSKINELKYHTAWISDNIVIISSDERCITASCALVTLLPRVKCFISLVELFASGCFKSIKGTTTSKAVVGDVVTAEKSRWGQGWIEYGNSPVQDATDSLTLCGRRGCCCTRCSSSCCRLLCRKCGCGGGRCWSWSFDKNTSSFCLQANWVCCSETELIIGCKTHLCFS